MTVDKLGVKLYDKVSAVVAELVANSYDADAEEVLVKLPLGTLLAKRQGSEEDEDREWTIEVIDDGHGMTPQEAIECYLKVGRDRRKAMIDGGRSRNKKRPVMGRKGIGKLAPFGICRRMEIISAGGEKTKNGYLVAHFFLDYDELLKDEETAVPITPGAMDGKYSTTSGTTVRLSGFSPKMVPDAVVFHRQLAARFVFARPDFVVRVEDARNPEANPLKKVERADVPFVESTKIDLATRPIQTEDGESLPVTGWLAMGKDSYKNEEEAGVRIYARNKLVATTRDFEQPAGFTGEFTIRSYLVGELTADWLDQDDGEDLVRSDRQSILWESDYGRALRTWGASLIREIGNRAKDPRRKRVSAIFLEKSKVAERAKERFGDPDVVAVAVDIAKQIGAFAAEDELQDNEYVEGLTDFILSVAPHKALIEAFRQFAKEVSGGEAPQLESLLDLFGKTRVAEMASYSQIAAERVFVIKELEKIVLTDSDESELQQLITRAPWLVEPTWTVITKNQTLKSFKRLFEEFYERRTGKPLDIAIGMETKRPDFTLVSLGHKLHVVEIKRPHYSFGDDDADRIINYLDAFDAFFSDNKEIRSEFPEGYGIVLVVDSLGGMKKSANRRSLEAAIAAKKLEQVRWNDFLLKARKAHEQFLEASDSAAAKATKPK